MKKRVQSPDSGFTDNCRSMNANKLAWVKFALQTLNRLPRNVGSGRCVNHNVFVGRFDPKNLVNRHENKTALNSNREPGKPAARIPFDLPVRKIQPTMRALQGRHKLILVEGL